MVSPFCEINVSDAVWWSHTITSSSESGSSRTTSNPRCDAACVSFTRAMVPSLGSASENPRVTVRPDARSTWYCCHASDPGGHRALDLNCAIADLSGSQRLLDIGQDQALLGGQVLEPPLPGRVGRARYVHAIDR